MPCYRGTRVVTNKKEDFLLLLHHVTLIESVCPLAV